jgi:hypothetical protein
VTGYSEIGCLIGPFPQIFRKLKHHAFVNDIMGPVSPLFPTHQTGLPQYLQVLRYGRFGDMEMTGKSAHTKIMGQEKIDDAKTGVVCQGLEDLHEIIHV